MTANWCFLFYSIHIGFGPMSTYALPYIALPHSHKSDDSVKGTCARVPGRATVAKVLACSIHPAFA